MRIGEVVTVKSFGKTLQFVVLGLYLDSQNGQEMVILSLLDPALIVTVAEEEVTNTEVSDLFGIIENDLTLH